MLPDLHRGWPPRHTESVTSAEILSRVFAGLTWLLALGWVYWLLQWTWHLPEVPDLTRESGSSLDASPAPDALTVIVPACNEQVAIGATLRSLLRSEGIRLQIIAVNDRSTDRTGEIMDAVASEHQREVEASPSHSRHSLEILHIAELPLEWLGKPHALALAAKQALSEWLLFTDGDVSFAPGAAALALRHAQATQTDHLILMPDWTLQSFSEECMHGALHALSTWTMRPWRIANPKAPDFLGIGAFNLVRRSVYEELGGFTSLRMEVLEDLRLGWKVKRAGFRQCLVLGPGLASVRWSEGAWGVVRNLEKNIFALYRYNLLIAFAATAGLALQVLWPLAALAAGGWARAGAILWFAAIAGLYVVCRRVTRVAPYCAVFYPLGAALFCFAHLRSIGLALWRGGVVWRGTLYRLDDLRAYAGRSWK